MLKYIMMDGMTDKKPTFTQWIQTRRKKDISHLLKSYIEEDWWPKEGRTLSDFILAARRNIPLELITLSFYLYKQETNGK